MATHSTTLAWKIPWTEEPGGLQSMGSQRVGHDWVTSLSLFFPVSPSGVSPCTPGLLYASPFSVMPSLWNCRGIPSGKSWPQEPRAGLDAFLGVLGVCGDQEKIRIPKSPLCLDGWQWLLPWPHFTTWVGAKVSYLHCASFSRILWLPKPVPDLPLMSQPLGY